MAVLAYSGRPAAARRCLSSPPVAYAAARRRLCSLPVAYAAASLPRRTLTVRSKSHGPD